jgi:alanyl-tRNA synthetase
MLCGSWALADYRRRYTDVAAMSAAMSVKQDDVTAGFERMRAEINGMKQALYTLRAKLEAQTVAAIRPTEGSICLFEEDLDANDLRRLLNAAVGKCGRLCGVFSGNDESGYRYVIGRNDPSIDLKKHVKEINAALSAKGGGSSEMLQGSCTATRAHIQAFFDAF